MLNEHHEHERTMDFRTMNGRWPGAGLGLVLGCLLFVVAQRCEAQNLVPNWSFEIPEDSCSWQCCFNVGSRPLHWYSWQNSPDHLCACAGQAGGDDTLVAVPQNGWTFQYPWEGEAYVGMAAYWGGLDYREYVGAALVEPLVVGCSYQLRFRTNPAHAGNYWLADAACNNLGMLFTTTSNAWAGITGPPFPFRNFAHLRALEPVVDTVGWILVEGTFTADSAYAHVVLGNFFSDALTEAVPLGSMNGLAFSLIDGVEVVPLDPTCHTTGVPESAPSEPQVVFREDGVHVNWEKESFRLDLTDISGRLVAQQALLRQGQQALFLPTTAGVYILRLTGRSRSFFRKFVVH